MAYSGSRAGKLRFKRGNEILMNDLSLADCEYHHHSLHQTRSTTAPTLSCITNERRHMTDKWTLVTHIATFMRSYLSSTTSLFYRTPALLRAVLRSPVIVGIGGSGTRLVVFGPPCELSRRCCPIVLATGDDWSNHSDPGRSRDLRLGRAPTSALGGRTRGLADIGCTARLPDVSCLGGGGE